MGEIIHGVNLPFAARAVVFLVDDTVNDGVAEVHVGVGHIDFGTQYHGPFGHFACVHLPEQLQALRHGPVAIGAVLAGLGRGTLLLGNLFAGLFVYICLSLLNEPNGKLVELVEVVRSVVYVSPLESQPFDVLLDSLYVFGVFLLRIGVVEAQVTHAAELLCHTEIHADGLGMANVQVAVRFGREARLQPACVLVVGEVVCYDLFDKVQALLFGGFGVISVFVHIGCILSCFLSWPFPR